MGKSKINKINAREIKFEANKMTEKKVLTASEVLALGKNHQDANKPSTDVTRPLEQENDLGNLLGVEVNDFDLENKKAQLKERARENCQFRLNSIWQLPTERV